VANTGPASGAEAADTIFFVGTTVGACCGPIRPMDQGTRLSTMTAALSMGAAMTDIGMGAGGSSGVGEVGGQSSRLW
jgi:hypothetical protein